MSHLTTSRITERITPHRPVIRSVRSDSGLLHPGVGLTKELLITVQKQVRSGTEPWKTYFEDMTNDEFTSYAMQNCGVLEYDL